MPLRPQFSLRLLLTLVAIAALAVWALREQGARRRAELRAEVARAEAEQAKQLAAALNVMSIALDGQRVYLWDVKKGSLIAIDRAKRLILWEFVLDMERHQHLLPVSPPQVERNFVILTDSDGNRRIVLEARTGAMIESR